MGNGPFGLSVDAKLEDLDLDPDATPKDNGLRLLKSVPTPSDQFKSYAVIAFPGVGICEIRAASEPITGDTLGGAAMGKVDAIAEVLESKYGKPVKTDICGGGEVSCGADNWTYALGSGERAYAYSWEKPAQTPPATIRNVRIAAIGQDIITSMVRIDYELNDAAKCKAAAKALGAAKL